MLIDTVKATDPEKVFPGTNPLIVESAKYYNQALFKFRFIRIHFNFNSRSNFQFYFYKKNFIFIPSKTSR